MPKWPRPVKALKSEIQEPIQRIAIVAVAAFALAALALFIAMGKVTNASA